MATEKEVELLSAAYAAGITSPRELANFMAQVSHESQGLKKMEESFVYSKGLDAIPVASARHSPDGEAARLEAMHGHPERLADLMYGGKMGNDHPGDGYKYRGRGYMQITGYRNYKEAGEALGIDLENHPELAATRDGSIKTSIFFWNRNVHDVAPEDVDAATYIINKKGLGLAERREHFAEWQERLTPEVMAGLARGENLLVAEQVAEAHGTGLRVVRMGDRSAAVGQLQQDLSTLGYTNSDGTAIVADERFGQRTHDAVESFQREHGLPVDGVVGSITRKALDQQLQAQAQAVQPPQFQWRLDDPNHPDHSLFQQAREHVHRLDQQVGRVPDQRSDNLAAALAVSARADGLERINQVALSDDASKLWAAQRPPGARDHFWDKLTNVEVAKAVDTPIEKSSAQWPQAVQQQAAQEQQEAQAQNQAVQQAVQGPQVIR